jgi:hypothetical protein
MNWLKRELAHGPLQAKYIYRDAEDNGITRPTLIRASDALDCVSFKVAFAGPWFWRLPEPDVAPEPDDGQETEDQSEGGDIDEGTHASCEGTQIDEGDHAGDEDDQVDEGDQLNEETQTRDEGTQKYEGAHVENRMQDEKDL